MKSDDDHHHFKTRSTTKTSQLMKLSNVWLNTWVYTRISSSDVNDKELLCTAWTQQHIKVLLNSFHLNGHTLGFHQQA